MYMYCSGSARAGVRAGCLAASLSLQTSRCCICTRRSDGGGAPLRQSRKCRPPGWFSNAALTLLSWPHPHPRPGHPAIRLTGGRRDRCTSRRNGMNSMCAVCAPRPLRTAVELRMAPLEQALLQARGATVRASPPPPTASAQHLLIMEALGGDQCWSDRFLAQVCSPRCKPLPQ